MRHIQTSKSLNEDILSQSRNLKSGVSLSISSSRKQSRTLAKFPIEASCSLANFGFPFAKGCVSSLVKDTYDIGGVLGTDVSQAEKTLTKKTTIAE